MSDFPRITDIRLERVDYLAPEGRCTGTNVMFRMNGRRMSSRLPWLVSSVAEAERHIRQTLDRSGLSHA